MFLRKTVDRKQRTVEFALSSETPVDRGNYIEILDHSPGSVDLSRLQNSHPLLLNHDVNQQVGVIEDAWLAARRIRCRVRFGTSALADEVFEDVITGIRKHVSVGYETTGEVGANYNKETGRQTVRFRWFPYEASIVAIPADVNVGIGRGKAKPGNTIECSVCNHCFTPERGDYTCPNCGTDFDPDEILPDDEEPRHHTITEPRRDNMPLGQRAKTKLWGLNRRDAENFSLVRAIHDVINHGHCTGFEREMFDEGRKRYTSEKILGNIFIPPDLMVGLNRSEPLFRDLNVTNAGQGGNFVQTDVMFPMIDILRNKMVTQKAGGQILAGLEGEVVIPRQSGAAIAYTVTEQQALTKSTQAIQQASMTPHRVGATTSFSKQLFLQTSGFVESFVRSELMKTLGVKLDYFVLQGPGGAMPLGIKNTNGISALTFGGSATWAKVLEFESDISNQNADIGRIAYITSPDVRLKWKQITPIGGSTVPTFLWNASLKYPDADGEVNGCRAFSSNQVDSAQVGYGNFEDAVLGIWNFIDITVDPVTSAQNATVNLLINVWVDVLARHAQSFVWSTDSGAQ